MRVSLFAEKLRAILKKGSVFFSTFKNKMLGKPGKEKLNKLIRSSVALVLMVVMLITLTFSWLKDSITSNISNSNYITIDADAGLQMNYGEEENPDGSININNSLRDGFMLHECSSVDGRNIFFPVYDYSASGDKNFVTNVNTNDLVFREATANDKNSKYISVDFTLSAKDDTDVWLSTNSSIKCESNSAAASAIRIAFVDKAVGGSSTVFDNALSSQYKDTNDAVKTISTLGTATTETCKPHYFGEYSYGNTDNNVLFHIDAGKTLNASMIVWLEGTDDECTNAALNVKDLDIYIKFTTSYEELKTITFIDSTLEKWVDDDDCYVYVIDTETDRFYQMSRENEESLVWTAEVPNDVKDILFTRYKPTTEGEKPSDSAIEWNSWDAGEIGSCMTYYAIGHNAGLWSNNFAPQVITLFDGSADAYLGTNNAIMHLMYDIEDGNGNTQSLDYKLSYQSKDYPDRYYYWHIVIPSDAKDISFKRMNEKEDPNVDWGTWSVDSIGSRGNNQYITLGSSNTGYWSNKLLYIEDTAKIKDNGGAFAGYFYGSTGTDVWTGMHACYKTSEDKYRYIAAVPLGKTGLVLTRYDSSQNKWDWNYKFAQFNDKNLEAFGSNNLFKISSENNGTISGTWYPTSNTW